VGGDRVGLCKAGRRNHLKATSSLLADQETVRFHARARCGGQVGKITERHVRSETPPKMRLRNAAKTAGPRVAPATVNNAYYSDRHIRVSLVNTPSPSQTARPQDLVTDPEEDREALFIVIPTTGPTELALRRLRQLDATWFDAAARRANFALNVTVEWTCSIGVTIWTSRGRSYRRRWKDRKRVTAQLLAEPITPRFTRLERVLESEMRATFGRDAIHAEVIRQLKERERWQSVGQNVERVEASSARRLQFRKRLRATASRDGS